MTAFDIYSTDANPRHIYGADGGTGDVDQWVDQLARVSAGPVDLFVDVPGSRVVWTFRAAKQDTSARTNRYLADFRGDISADTAELFAGFHDYLSNISSSDMWTFPDDGESRWTAGFDLARVDGACPGLTDDEEDAIDRLVSGDFQQAVVGMSSYDAALQTVKRLAEREVDGTVAINSHGATPETEGIDLVLWPGADEDFQPVTTETKEALARAGFRHEDEMTVADETPSESVTEVKHRHETESPLERFVGDTVGRIGAGLTAFFSATSVGSLFQIGPLHQLSGLSGIGGFLGAVLGLVVVQAFGGSDLLTDGGVADATEGTASSDVGVGNVLSTADWNWQQYAAFSGYWLTLAYAFPTIFRLAGWPPTGDPPITLTPAISAVLLYVAILLTVSLLVYGVWAVRSDVENHVGNVGSLLVIHALFAVGLVVFNGLSCALWYGLLGYSC